MRTTIDLPPELHALARRLAHEERRSMSEVITQLIRLGLRQEPPAVLATSRGLPQVSIGHPITAEDVRSLDDEG